MTLLYAGVEVGVIEAFGMKMPEHLVERMAEIQRHLENLEERLDIIGHMWWYTTFQLHKRRESFPIVAHGWVWVRPGR